MRITCFQSLAKLPTSPLLPVFFPTYPPFSPSPFKNPCLKPYKTSRYSIGYSVTKNGRGRNSVCGVGLLPVDPWAPNIDSQSIASQLFAFSLLPYIGFLYFITKSKSAPKLTLFGFYFLLAFVGATIPAGIYAKVHYGTSLSNVDWLHGGAESLLTLTNLFIVLGLRQALRKATDIDKTASDTVPAVREEKESSI